PQSHIRSHQPQKDAANEEYRWRGVYPLRLPSAGKEEESRGHEGGDVRGDARQPSLSLLQQRPPRHERDCDQGFVRECRDKKECGNRCATKHSHPKRDVDYRPRGEAGESYPVTLAIVTS